MTRTGGAVVGPTPEAKTAAPPISPEATVSRQEPLFGILAFRSLADLGRDVRAGVATAIVTLPVSLSGGLLAYAPCGPTVSTRGAAAGLLGATVGGFFAALAARSSFIISSPRASSALVLASLATAVLAHEPFTGNLALTGIAMAICLLLAGLWQIAFGVIGLGTIIKFTPHPVLAGFLNGVAVLIAMGAFRIVSRGSSVHDSGIVAALVFAAVLTALILYIEQKTKRVPGPIVGLAIGTAAFYAFGAVLPGLSLGPTVGHVAIEFTAVLGSTVTAVENYAAALRAEAPQILLTSFVLAVVASLDSLLAARAARNVAPIPASPGRFLVGQGIGNIASAISGGVPVSAVPSQTLANFSAGGRTRLSGLTTASVLLAFGILMPALLAAIPLAVLCAILVTISIRIVDPWSVRLLRDTLFGKRKRSGSAWKNLTIIGAVMTVTAYWSVTAGLLTGIGLSCLIFIIGMSRPLVRRRHRGDALFSRRVRPERDVEILRRSGHLLVVLELEGVMFFGNADDLCAEVEDLFAKASIVVLDFRHVADIDISAIGALQQAVSKALAKKKKLLFCHLPLPHLDLFESLTGSGGEGTVFADLDAALEWSEEKVLAEVGRSEFEEIPFDRIELLEGLDPHQIGLMRNYLMPMAFPAGTVLCHEGEEAGFLWILSRGSVSVWLGGHGEQPGTRIAALARGTIVGEMSLFDEGTRSGTVLADEDVTGYMIDKETFELILREHPKIATTLLANIAREMARRLRNTSRIVAAETG